MDELIPEPTLSVNVNVPAFAKVTAKVRGVASAEGPLTGVKVTLGSLDQLLVMEWTTLSCPTTVSVPPLFPVLMANVKESMCGPAAETMTVAVPVSPVAVMMAWIVNVPGAFAVKRPEGSIVFPPFGPTKDQVTGDTNVTLLGSVKTAVKGSVFPVTTV